MPHPAARLLFIGKYIDILDGCKYEFAELIQNNNRNPCFVLQPDFVRRSKNGTIEGLTDYTGRFMQQDGVDAVQAVEKHADRLPILL